MSEEHNPYAPPLADTSLSPGTYWAQDVSSSLRWTKIGLTLVYSGIVLMLLSIILLVGTPFLGAQRGLRTFVLLFGAAGFGVLLAQILTIIGPLFCLAVPSASGAKGFIVGAVILQLLSLAAVIARQFAVGMIPRPVGLALNLTGFVGVVLFALFMKKLAEYIGRKDLASQARNLLIGMGVLLLLGLVMVAGMLAEITALGILGIVVLVGGLLVFIMYANLVNSLRKALGVVQAS